jgi:hypothetical protein
MVSYFFGISFVDKIVSFMETVEWSIFLKMLFIMPEKDTFIPSCFSSFAFIKYSETDVFQFLFRSCTKILHF